MLRQEEPIRYYIHLYLPIHRHRMPSVPWRHCTPCTGTRLWPLLGGMFSWALFFSLTTFSTWMFSTNFSSPSKMSLNSNFAYANAHFTSLPRCLRNLKLNVQKTELVIPESPTLLRSFLYHNTGQQHSPRTNGQQSRLLTLSLSQRVHAHAHPWCTESCRSGLHGIWCILPFFPFRCHDPFHDTSWTLMVTGICAPTLSHLTNSILQQQSEISFYNENL